MPTEITETMTKDYETINVRSKCRWTLDKIATAEGVSAKLLVEFGRAVEPQTAMDSIPAAIDDPDRYWYQQSWTWEQLDSSYSDLVDRWSDDCLYEAEANRKEWERKQ